MLRMPRRRLRHLQKAVAPALDLSSGRLLCTCMLAMLTMNSGDSGDLTWLTMLRGCERTSSIEGGDHSTTEALFTYHPLCAAGSRLGAPNGVVRVLAIGGSLLPRMGGQDPPRMFQPTDTPCGLRCCRNHALEPLEGPETPFRDGLCVWLRALQGRPHAAMLWAITSTNNLGPCRPVNDDFCCMLQV